MPPGHGEFMAKFQNIKPAEVITNWYQNARADKFFWLFLVIWFVPISITILVTFFSINNLPLQIPLFYSRPWGQLQLAKTPYLFLPMAGAFLLGIFNFATSLALRQKSLVLSYLLEGAAALVSTLAAITVINIIILMR